MIKPSELRIGNVLCQDFPGILKDKPFPVTGIFIQQLEEYPSDKYKGIPLTPEILLQSGFLNNPTGRNHDSYELNGTSFLIYRWQDHFMYALGNAEIKYVHQLQNLYFALSGTELPINL